MTLVPVPDPPSDGGRTPPHDVGAEQAVLGAMMMSPPACKDALRILTGPDFYRLAHETVFLACRALHLAGKHPDPVVVNAHLQDAGELGRVGGAPYLHTLMESVPTAANLSHHAEIVRRHALRRSLIEAGTRIVQDGYSQGDGDPMALAERAVVDLTTVRDSGLLEDAAELPDVHDFLAGSHAYDWLVPGLLERGDRLILTGTEGHGKSSLVRQLTVCVAAGLHPFRHKPVEPARVLMVDCENGRVHSRRKLAPLVASAADAGHPVGRGVLRIECRPNGINLASTSGRRWLLGQVERYRPDLITIGPLYKLHEGNINDEELARQITAVLDACREAVGCSIVTEAHSPHAPGGREQRPMRPAGASLFMRWPEFGFGLRPVAKDDGLPRLTDVVTWRGPRDERAWPTQLYAGPRWSWEDPSVWGAR
jgi:DnaB-like helicase N terminal domain/AAA domain